MTVQPGIQCTFASHPGLVNTVYMETFSLASWDSGITLLGSWQTGLRFSHIIAWPNFTFGMFNSPQASHTNYVDSSMQFQNVMYSV